MTNPFVRCYSGRQGCHCSTCQSHVTTMPPKATQRQANRSSGRSCCGSEGAAKQLLLYKPCPRSVIKEHETNVKLHWMSLGQWQLSIFPFRANCLLHAPSQGLKSVLSGAQ